MLERNLEDALMAVRMATDSMGLKIFINTGHHTITIGARLRELVAMTEGHPMNHCCTSVEECRANLARNCLLVVQAYDAAAQLEAHIGERPGVRENGCRVENGVVFGRATLHD